MHRSDEILVIALAKDLSGSSHSFLGGERKASSYSMEMNLSALYRGSKRLCFSFCKLVFGHKMKEESKLLVDLKESTFLYRWTSYFLNSDLLLGRLHNGIIGLLSQAQTPLLAPKT